MKVYIFFGHHKVGSTALQSYLSQNCLALMRSGILYPPVEGEGTSHLLRQLLNPELEPDLASMNLREPHNALAFRMLNSKTKGKIPAWHAPLPGLDAMKHMLRHQVDILEPHTVILCSEVFANFGTNHHDLIAQLHELFPQAEFELYCVLRRPDEYLASWFGQRLRFGHKLPALSDLDGINFDSIHFNYMKMLEPWIAEFKDCKVHVRNYADVLAAGGSVVDFTSILDCDLPQGLCSSGPSNPGLPRAAYEILRQGNQVLGRAQAARLRDAFDQLPKPHVKDSNVELFGTEQRTRLAAKFEPIHAYLSELTGADTDGGDFFPDFDEIRQTKPVELNKATRKILTLLPPSALPNSELRNFVKRLKATI